MFELTASAAAATPEGDAADDFFEEEEVSDEAFDEEEVTQQLRQLEATDADPGGTRCGARRGGHGKHGAHLEYPL